MSDYEQACMDHAEHQGLLPVLTQLTRLFPDTHLYQSGGFCMVIEIPAPTEKHPEGYVWVTNDGTEDHPEYVVGFYEEVDQDATRGEATYDYKYVDSPGAVAEVVQAYRQGKDMSATP